MPDVRPFVGLLYDPSIAGPLSTLTAPPYDLISPAEQERLHRMSPFNVVRLILGREGSADDPLENKYTRAASVLREWLARGVLAPTAGPVVFPYELRFHFGGKERVVKGVVAEVELDPSGHAIVPHERTLPGPIEDRLALLRAVRANLSAVYAVYSEPVPGVSSLLGRVGATPPDREVVDTSGTVHRLWVAEQGAEVVAEELRDKTLMIADGHHRYTVALAYREEMRARFGSGPWDRMMMFLVDAATEDPPVLPYHRLLVGEDRLPEPAGERVRDLAEALASLSDDALTYGLVRTEDGEVVHRVARLEGEPPTVCVLHQQVLDRVGSARMEFVPDAVTAEQAVLSGRVHAAFLLPPTRVERVIRLVRTGQTLPQKSTYFWPKPRTGLVIRPLSP